MKLNDKQIEVLDRIAMGKAPLARDWRTRIALVRRGLILHNAATWKYPEPYYKLTDSGVSVWSEYVTVKAVQE